MSRLRRPLRVLAFVVAAAALRAASIKITAPSPQGTVSGIYKFSVDVSAAPTVDRVQYRLGSLSLGFATAPPFDLKWNSGLASDGNYSVEAIAYDARGAVIGAADQVFTVQNRGGSITVEGVDLSAPLHGKVKLPVTGFDPLYYPARWAIFVDGALQTIVWTDNTGQNKVTAQLSIDTTHLSNGRHELHVEVGSDFWPKGQQEKKSWYNARLGLHRVIVTDNGRVPKGISANLQHVYLSPGQSTALRCQELNTDDSSALCASPSYASSDPAVVVVDATGKLTAQNGEGFSRIAIQDGGEKTEAYVWVKKNPNVAHFAGDGRLLTEYQPGVSIFPVAPFFLGVSDVQNQLVDREVKRAGVNTLYSGFYLNPRSLLRTLSAWESDYDSRLAPDWRWAAQHGYHLYVMGDEIARGIGGEAWWTLNWPSAKAAVQHAMQSVASSGVAIGADIIDEGSMMWGGNPTPPRHVGEPGMFTSIICNGNTCTVDWPNNPVKPGRFYAGDHFALTGSQQRNLDTPAGQMFAATNITGHSFDFTPAGPVYGTFSASNDPGLEFLWWAGGAGGCPSNPCNPPIPNTALLTIAEWLRSANPHVSISWPALGIAPPVAHNWWAGNDSRVSDFFSHYWDSFQAGHTYPWSNGVAERNHWMREAFYSRQPFAAASKPQIILDSISSYFYRKNAPGAYFNPLQDDLLAAPTSPAAISAGMMTAAAIGNAGVRLYQYDTVGGAQGRSSARVGAELQSGASPIAEDAYSRQLWRSIGYTANLLTKTLQPFILGTAVSSPALGENIVTAVRQSARGILLLAVNGNDWDRTVTVNLAPYRHAGLVSRYVVEGTGISLASLPDSPSDEVDLLPGATAIYLLPASASVKFLTAVPIGAPTLPPGASAAFVHQGYIYGEDLDSRTKGLECTQGCNLTLDGNLGDAYYQFSFTNAQGVVVGKSPVRVLGGRP